jgi:hypothetical protein
VWLKWYRTLPGKLKALSSIPSTNKEKKHIKKKNQEINKINYGKKMLATNMTNQIMSS